jgi:hypothetical protein
VETFHPNNAISFPAEETNKELVVSKVRENIFELTQEFISAITLK